MNIFNSRLNLKIINKNLFITAVLHLWIFKTHTRFVFGEENLNSSSNIDVQFLCFNFE